MDLKNQKSLNSEGSEGDSEGKSDLDVGENIYDENDDLDGLDDGSHSYGDQQQAIVSTGADKHFTDSDEANE